MKTPINFRQLTDRYFGFLRTEFGFLGPSTVVDTMYQLVRYRRGQVGVTVNFDALDQTVITTIERLNNDLEWPRRDQDSVGIVELAKLKAITTNSPRTTGERLSGDQVDDLLRAHADLLRRVGSEVLRGNMESFDVAIAARASADP